VNKKLIVSFPVLLSLVILSLAACYSQNTAPALSSAKLSFLVTDGNDRPLQGAKVVSNDQPEGQPKLTGLTGAGGTVVFQDIKPGDYLFYVNRFDYNQTEVSTTVIAQKSNDIALRLSLSNPPSPSPTGIAGEITFAQLASQPEKYNNQTVTLAGFWFDGFEIAVLAERLEPAGFAPGNLQPAGVKIWVKNGLPQEINQRLYLQPDNPTGYPAHYGKVELTGMLEYGSKYGHLGAYMYQLTVQSATLMPWNAQTAPSVQ